MDHWIYRQAGFLDGLFVSMKLHKYAQRCISMCKLFGLSSCLIMGKRVMVHNLLYFYVDKPGDADIIMLSS